MSQKTPDPQALDKQPSNQTQTPESDQRPADAVEIGGRKGLEPTRYGDWEMKGRCIDF